MVLAIKKHAEHTLFSASAFYWICSLLPRYKINSSKYEKRLKQLTPWKLLLLTFLYIAFMCHYFIELLNLNPIIARKEESNLLSTLFLSVFSTACFVFIFFHTKIVFIQFDFSYFAFPTKHAWIKKLLLGAQALKVKRKILNSVLLEWATVKATPTGLMLPSSKKMKPQNADRFSAYSKEALKSVSLRINASLAGVLVFNRNKI